MNEYSQVLRSVTCGIKNKSNVLLKCPSIPMVANSIPEK